MFDVGTEHYLDAFDCPMRFALHDITVKKCYGMYEHCRCTVGTDKDKVFYFRSKTVPKLYIRYF